jgi:hypothetical protein
LIRNPGALAGGAIQFSATAPPTRLGGDGAAAPGRPPSRPGTRSWRPIGGAGIIGEKREGGLAEVNAKLAGIVLAAVLAARIAPASGQNALVVADDKAPACKHPATLEQLLAQIGKPPYMRMILRDMASGDCIVLQKDAPVSVTGYSAAERFVRIRLNGSPDNYWTPERALRSPQPWWK